MFAGLGTPLRRLRVRASDESARVDEVRRHASEAHGVDLSADVALAVVRRVTARDVHRAFNPGPGTAEVRAFYVIPEGAGLIIPASPAACAT